MEQYVALTLFVQYLNLDRVVSPPQDEQNIKL